MNSKKSTMRKNGLIKKILINYLSFFSIFLLSFYVYYYNSNKLISDRISSSMQFSMAQMKGNLENYINEITKTMNMLSLDNSILDSINKDYSNGEYRDYLIDFLRVKKQIDVLKSSFLLSKCNVIIVDMKGNVFSTYSDWQLKANSLDIKSDLIKKTIERNGYLTFFKYKREDILNEDIYNLYNNYDTADVSKNNDSLIIITKLIKRGSNQIGCLMITMKQNQFEKIIDDSKLQNGAIILTNPNGDIFYASGKDSLNAENLEKVMRNYIEDDKKSYFTFKYNNKKFIGAYTSVNVSNWGIAYTIPYDILFEDMNRLRTILVIFSTVIGAIILMGLLFLLKDFFLPVKTLNKQIKKVQAGDFNVRISIETNDELQELYDNFNTMVTKIKENIATIKKDQLTLFNKQKTEAELKYQILQSQINPHFLFNTLNNIKWIASMNNIPIIVDMIAALGNLLEISTNKIENMITIEKELAYLQDYMLLQKVRYGDKFDVKIKVEDNLLNCKILKLILQPIVENAIKHGLAGKPGKGNIIINGYTSENGVIFEVIDDGCGITSDKIDEINNSLSSNHEKFNSIGIHNIDSRLKLIYGKSYGIDIESEPGEGTKVTVVLPKLMT